MIVTHANEIDCSVRAAAASLRMYKDEFDDCYTKLSKAIEKASKNVDSYERALDKVD
ncbi:MAG: hypothetical protein KGY45_03590 [Hadesarchaea archaeon]|nr:hypothetical protein [Hadesarchaea archaeon]